MKKEVCCAMCGATLKRNSAKTDTYFCGIACKAEWQVRQRESLGFTKEWLVEQYFVNGKTCNDIAREIGRDSKRVWEWFKQYGIDVNKRGSNWKENLSLTGEFWRGKTHTDDAKEKIRQARIKDGGVPYLKDGKHWLHHEGAISPNWKGGITPDRQGVYSSKEWSESVKIVWNRDDATCQICKKRQNEYREKKFHIHHIESFMVKDKRTDPDNLILLCPDCHKFVHSKKNTEKIYIK